MSRRMFSREFKQEAADLIRKLVGKIVLKPGPNGSGQLIDLHGDFAGILSIASESGKQLKPEELSFVQDSGAQKSLDPAFSRLSVR